jgi:hypothetical protein
MKRAMFSTVLWAVMACDPRVATPETNPFAAAQADSAAWSGRIRERLEAGSYTYLLVDRPGDGPAWVVTLKSAVPDAERVSVRVLKKSENFESKRLGRSFSALYFVLLRKES